MSMLLADSDTSVIAKGTSFTYASGHKVSKAQLLLHAASI